LEAEFSPVCDIVKLKKHRRYLFNISIVSHFAVEIDSHVRLEC